MKIARELFEELGWYLDIETNDNQIVYSKNKFNNDTFGFIGAKAITFDKEMESVYLDDVNDISMLLLQAINQQINELGWNDTIVNLDVKLDSKKVMEVIERTDKNGIMDKKSR